MLASSISRSSAAAFLAVLLLLNGATVSTLYLAQSVAALVRADFGPSAWTGLAPSATLAGYAIGVALLASVARDLTTAHGLGLHALLLGAGLSAAAVAPTALVLAVACLVIGLGCALTQRTLACATSMVSVSQRGPTIGIIVASGLFGIVIARAGIPAASLALGWRTMFSLDAAVIGILGLLAAGAAQGIHRQAGEGERAPLPSAVALWRREPELRRAALRQACVFAAFNAGWAIFPRVLTQAGLSGATPMGAVASLGALSALGAGLLCRRFGADRVAIGGVIAVLLAVVTALGIAAGPMILGIMVVLDVGTQAALVANQAQAQARATSPAMRGRLAAIVTTVGFAAGAVGAALGNTWP